MRRNLLNALAALGVLAAAAIFAPNLEAQTGKLTGTVMDAASGTPLEGVQIQIQGTGISALTAANGRYFIINVPPGTYQIIARRLGYQPLQINNVGVQIDVTRNLNFELQPATAVELEEILVEVEETPLVQQGVSASASNIQAEEIAALPVINIQGALSLQQGFQEIPDNTDIVSFTSTRRNPITPVSIRGGRGGETLTLIDLVPINNVVFGGPAFDFTTEAIQQVDFQRGGFEPQYGNALSGIINIATREGGTRLAGSMSYQTSAVGGALGNTQDELRDFDLYQGFVSGPVPGSSNRLRFMIAGRNTGGADRVLEFDDFINEPSRECAFANVQDCGDSQQIENAANPARGNDVFRGWRAVGYDQTRDIFGKLTFYLQPTMKLSVTGIGYRRQRLPFDFDYLLVGFNPLESDGAQNLEDSLGIARGEEDRGGAPAGLGGNNSRNSRVIQGSIEVERELLTARWDHTFGRWAYKIVGGLFNQSRSTCNFFEGICLADSFSDPNFEGNFTSSLGQQTHPTYGTDLFFGGEDVESKVLRVDIQGQATDHHNVQFGAFWQQHDIIFDERRNVGTNNVIVLGEVYRADPWEAAVYFQDKIEYDFLTVKLGARFDFGEAGGQFFADPRDPTNGTTAIEVCDDQFGGFVENCAGDQELIAEAAEIAQADDFAEAERRNQFSPRIGVSFPLSEGSAVFFNFGRYSQNPLYNNLFQSTGVGTVAGEEDGVCDEDEVIPGTTQCHPIIFSDQGNVPFIGNPNLLIEKTTLYEIGFATELADVYALQVTAFAKDQFGLTGLKPGGQDDLGNVFFDVGATYGTSQYSYQVLVNQDFQTVRGFEISLRRRLSDFWGFNINYQFSQAKTNAAAPDQEFERQGEFDPVALQEITSIIDQPHAFNASMFFRVGNNDRPFGNDAVNAVLRNSNLTLTLRAASGLPFTPTTNFFGNNQIERNSGRAPGTFRIDLLAGKDFNIGNLRYGAFVRVVNLLDTQNCVQVFASTGECDVGTVDQSRRNQGNGFGQNTSTTDFNRPQFIGVRRTINAGLRLSF